MAKYSIEVGTQEKHTVSYLFNPFLGITKVEVDGIETPTKFALGGGVQNFEVGNYEKHLVRIRHAIIDFFSGPRFFVDGIMTAEKPLKEKTGIFAGFIDFSKPADSETALKEIPMVYTTYYFAAIIMAALSYYTKLGSFTDAILFFYIAVLIQWMQSRIAAFFGMILMAAVLCVTFFNRAVQRYGSKQAQEGHTHGGSNIWVAGILFLMGVKGLMATFYYHQLRKKEGIKTTALERLQHWMGGTLLTVIVVFVLNQTDPNALSRLANTYQKVAAFRPPSQSSPDSNSKPVEEEKEPQNSGGTRTFRLKSGEQVTGEVIVDDPVYYTVKTRMGEEKIILKEDLA